MRGCLLFFFTIVLAHDFESEFNHLKEHVLNEMRFYSPGDSPENLKYYLCPQGLPGIRGMSGISGETQEEFWLHTEEILNQQELSDGLECHIPSGVEYVMRKLEAHKIYNSSMPRGMPGLRGPKGYSTSKTMKIMLRDGCYRRSFNVSQPCLTTIDVYLDILKMFQVPSEKCPDQLAGPIGRMGPRGASGELPFKNNDEFESYLDQICPLAIE